MIDVVANGLIVASMLASQAGPPPTPQTPGRAADAATVTREDLARAYLAFDGAATAAFGSWSPEEREKANREFDAITGLFFAANLKGALNRLHALMIECAGVSPEDAPSVKSLLEQRWTAEPRWILSEAEPIVRLRALGQRGDAALPALTAIVRGPDGTALSQPFAEHIRLVGEGRAAVGSYAVSLAVDGLRGEVTCGRVAVLGEAPESVAKRLQTRLDELERDGIGRERDRAALASRLKLLTPESSSTRSAQFLADLAALARDTSMELAAIERGESAWRGRRGDHWRTIRAIAVDVPCRVFAPEELPADARPPLLIALHGAGGDESMFLDGYGAGRLKALARANRFVVVSPSTTTFAATPVVFDAIVDEMTYCANIDPARVFVIGHSLGAVATSSIAGRRGERIAGIAMIAGSGAAPLPEWPPLMLVAGALDPLFPIQRMRTNAEAMRATVPTFTYVEIPHDGHTLVVTTALPAVVDWLLALPARAASGGASPDSSSKGGSSESPRGP
jgi:predicted esterase